MKIHKNTARHLPYRKIASLRTMKTYKLLAKALITSLGAICLQQRQEVIAG